jgi:tetratricopeptide (TPR) repeat protein
MGRAAVRTSPALGRFLREKRRQLGLTVRAVSKELAEKGERLPESTLVRIEQGKLDPGVRRLHRLLHLYSVPPHLVADLIELEDLAVAQPPEGDLETLHREGVECWKRGDVAHGLAYLFAVRQRVPPDAEARIIRQRATLAFAIYARNLGKLQLARQVLEDLLCEPPERSLVVNVLVMASVVWDALGAKDAAMALAAHAATLLPPGRPDLEAWVHHQNARLLASAGRFEEAEKVLVKARNSYRGAEDPYGEGKALISLTLLRESQGDLAAAVLAAREALGFAEESRVARVVLLCRIELGRLLTKSGAIGEGLQVIQQALGQAIQVGDRNAEFAARYCLWKAYVGLGDRERARFELEAAIYCVRFVDETFPEADEIRGLGKKGGGHVPSDGSRSPV